MNQRCLEGVRIVDFSWVVAGPFCTKFLGLMGADVIKVESSSRPQYKNRAKYFKILNNSKLSCAIDLSTPDGKEIVKRLVSVSDIVVENFSTGVMDRLGLGYNDLRQVKQDVIYVTSSGLGRTGPGRDYLAYGTLLQGLSGWTSLFNETNPRMDATGISPGWTDVVTGLWELQSILAALYHRSETGKGLYVDLSMLESTITSMGDLFLQFAATGRVPTPGATSVGLVAVPHGIYPCQDQDSWIAISARNQLEWDGLCCVLGEPSWKADEALLTQEDRLRNREQVDRLVAQQTARYPVMDLFTRLQEVGVPAGPCYGIQQVPTDPHMVARGFFADLSENGGEPEITTGLPWTDETGWRGRLFRAPDLGEHNRYVFQDLLGMPDDEYERYRAAGVLE